MWENPKCTCRLFFVVYLINCFITVSSVMKDLSKDSELTAWLQMFQCCSLTYTAKVSLVIFEVFLYCQE